MKSDKNIKYSENEIDNEYSNKKKKIRPPPEDSENINSKQKKISHTKSMTQKKIVATSGHRKLEEIKNQEEKENRQISERADDISKTVTSNPFLTSKKAEENNLSKEAEIKNSRNKEPQQEHKPEEEKKETKSISEKEKEKHTTDTDESIICKCKKSRCVTNSCKCKKADDKFNKNCKCNYCLNGKDGKPRLTDCASQNMKIWKEMTEEELSKVLYCPCNHKLGTLRQLIYKDVRCEECGSEY